MYDIHTHILPGFDDGAENLQEALALLGELKRQNVNNVYLTPHFYSTDESVEGFIERRDRTFQKHAEELRSLGQNIMLGAEVYISRYLTNQSGFYRLKLGNTNFVLLEIPNEDELLDYILLLIQQFKDEGLNPIIAHIERYNFTKNDFDRLSILKQRGCLFQMNLASINSNKYSKVSKKLLKHGMIDIFASDCHNLHKRMPVFDTLLPKLNKKFQYSVDRYLSLEDNFVN